MACMINKDEFKSQLQIVLDNIYPSRDTYQKMSYYAVEPKVREEMYKYVQDKYALYYRNELPKLFKERNRLLEKCLEELGVKK